jgi:hypothetical protein
MKKLLLLSLLACASKKPHAGVTMPKKPAAAIRMSTALPEQPWTIDGGWPRFGYLWDGGAIPPGQTYTWYSHCVVKVGDSNGIAVSMDNCDPVEHIPTTAICVLPDGGGC